MSLVAGIWKEDVVTMAPERSCADLLVWHACKRPHTWGENNYKQRPIRAQSFVSGSIPSGGKDIDIACWCLILGSSVSTAQNWLNLYWQFQTVLRAVTLTEWMVFFKQCGLLSSLPTTPIASSTPLLILRNGQQNLVKKRKSFFSSQ